MFFFPILLAKERWEDEFFIDVLTCVGFIWRVEMGFSRSFSSNEEGFLSLLRNLAP